ncbi:hypothetical protein CMV_013052 [Castanea mollissima]|uniref:Uncharacterized protein n=1 Tax=Castanea mollissima TaxID=60419 RepID=A0A8J4RE63_9ROSI|nr:hypothetical protein CMV_013052 [Castanea mollissima]
MPHSSGKVLMEYGSEICPLQASHARLCSWHYAYLDDKFFTREDAGLIGKVLMEYASGIFLDVLAKDEAESKKPNWLLMDSINDHHLSIQGATWGTAIWQPGFAVGIMHTCERSASVNNVQSASGL